MELDPLIHQQIRTKIVALLVHAGSADYTTIKNDIEITDGHMSTHMKALIEAKYVEVKKEFVDNKPKTTYKLSTLGRKRFHEYVKQLKILIGE